MSKFQSPLLGYNNNVRHRGRVFHIQTEDSGVNHPHIITHLFMDGGRILKSVKKSYAEHVGTDGMKETVRVLMKEQHKAMFIALRDGQFDEPAFGKPTDEAVKKAAAAVAAKEAAAARAVEPSPMEIVPESTTDLMAVPPAMPAPEPSTEVLSEPPVAMVEESPKTIAEPAPVVDVRAETALPAPDDPPTEIEVHVEVELESGAAVEPAPPEPAPAVSGARVAVAPPPPTADESPKTTREPEKRRPSAQELTLDFDALERGTGSVGALNPYRSQSDLPPPPKNLFAREPRTGAYSALSDQDSHHDHVPPSRPHRASRAPARPSSTPRTPSQPSQRPAAEGRYAPARPAAIFGAAAKQTSTSIFGDELLSDKSLDEVILSYLAEDLDPPRRK